MIEAYIITMSNHEGSVAQATRCRNSSVVHKNPFDIKHFEAVTMDFAQREYDKRGFEFHQAYQYKEHMPACTMSHYILWEKALKRPILILEHDAVFIDQFTEEAFDRAVKNPHAGVVALYQPHSQTGGVRRGDAGDGISLVQRGSMAHAYIMKPDGAARLISNVKKNGFITQHDRFKFCHQFDFLGGFEHHYVEDSAEWKTSNLATSA